MVCRWYKKTYVVLLVEDVVYSVSAVCSSVEPTPPQNIITELSLEILFNYICIHQPAKHRLFKVWISLSSLYNVSIYSSKSRHSLPIVVGNGHPSQPTLDHDPPVDTYKSTFFFHRGNRQDRSRLIAIVIFVVGRRHAEEWKACNHFCWLSGYFNVAEILL